LITMSYLDESVGTYVEVELPSGHPHMRLPGASSQAARRCPSSKGPIPVLVDTALALAEAMNGREQQPTSKRQGSSIETADPRNSSGASAETRSGRAIRVLVESIPPQAAVSSECGVTSAVATKDFPPKAEDDAPVMMISASHVFEHGRGEANNKERSPTSTSQFPPTSTMQGSSSNTPILDAATPPDAEWHFRDGDFVDIWSGPRRAWLTAKVVQMRSAGSEAAAGARLVTVTYRDASGLRVYEEVGPERLRRPARKVCSDGTSCKLRQQTSHLFWYVHPFESDYLDTCERCGNTPMEPSLRQLFEWVDSDGSGRITRWELEAALPLLSRIVGEAATISEDAWMRLGEDGSGTVGFREFAQWAGPRLGLPLDGEVSREASESSLTTVPCAGSGSMEEAQVSQAAEEVERTKDNCCCGILGCPCKQYELALGDSDSWTATCTCGHKRSAHTISINEPDAFQLESRYPSHWISLPSRDMSTQMVRLGQSEQNSFQVLFQETYRDIWTRDRKKNQSAPFTLPRGYRVLRGFRCESPHSWCRYQARREQMLEIIQDGGAFELYEDVLSNDVWHAVGICDGDQVLSHKCNEWYLFFGTSIKSAENICTKGFKRGAPIGNTGSLYGKGAYFAESITKADEHAKPNEAGECAIVFCRVLGGRVLYTDAAEPDPENLVHSCINGPYDCVLGDREKNKGTFREFVLFDADRILPEFVVHYTREMPASEDTEAPEGSSECVVA